MSNLKKENIKKEQVVDNIKIKSEDTITVSFFDKKVELNIFKEFKDFIETVNKISNIEVIKDSKTLLEFLNRKNLSLNECLEKSFLKNTLIVPADEEKLPQNEIKDFEARYEWNSIATKITNLRSIKYNRLKKEQKFEIVGYELKVDDFKLKYILNNLLYDKLNNFLAGHMHKYNIDMYVLGTSEDNISIYIGESNFNSTVQGYPKSNKHRFKDGEYASYENIAKFDMGINFFNGITEDEENTILKRTNIQFGTYWKAYDFIEIENNETIIKTDEIIQKGLESRDRIIENLKQIIQSKTKSKIEKKKITNKL